MCSKLKETIHLSSYKCHTTKTNGNLFKWNRQTRANNSPNTPMTLVALQDVLAFISAQNMKHMENRVTSLRKLNSKHMPFLYFSACECVVYSSEGRSSGTFTSPNYPKIYPTNINCILYTFMGAMGEIVEVTFFEFDLQVPTSIV